MIPLKPFEKSCSNTLSCLNDPYNNGKTISILVKYLLQNMINITLFFSIFTFKVFHPYQLE